MTSSLQPIPLLKLALAFIPALVVVAILFRWSMGGGKSLYAMARMLVQLLLIGHVLTLIFESDRASLVLIVLTVMLFVASWISLYPLQHRGRGARLRALASISVGGILTLILVTWGILDVSPWYKAQFVLPLAGMIFASSMNTVSLAAERFESEMARSADYVSARRLAYRAALIPLINSFFAVGVVSFPGMMTGQILAGESPLVAARYQIMVMCMIFGAGGISAACYLQMLRPPLAAGAPDPGVSD